MPIYGQEALNIFFRQDRYLAVYAADRIWKRTADLLSRLGKAAILKSQGVLAVFSGFEHPEEIFQVLNFPSLNALKKSKSVCVSLQGERARKCSFDRSINFKLNSSWKVVKLKKNWIDRHRTCSR